MKQKRYLDNEFNQKIVEDMECLYADVSMSIPEEEMENIKIEISAEQFCCMAELLMAMLATYEGYGDDVDMEELCAIHNTFH